MLNKTELTKILKNHQKKGTTFGGNGYTYPCVCGWKEYGKDFFEAEELFAAHQADMILGERC